MVETFWDTVCIHVLTYMLLLQLQGPNIGCGWSVGAVGCGIVNATTWPMFVERQYDQHRRRLSRGNEDTGRHCYLNECDLGIELS